MTEEENHLLDRMVEVIVHEANPKTIILFGSRARGEAGPDSDVDLLIVDNQPYSPKRSRRYEIHRLAMALRHFPITKDILLYSQDEL